MMLPFVVEVFVAGRPAPFATTGERPWKDAIAARLSDVSPPSLAARCLDLTFVVAASKAYPLGADLDNLCEPVFSVLANRLRWFGGTRVGVTHLRARKTVGPETGCLIRVAEICSGFESSRGDLLLSAESSIPLPFSARDANWAKWAADAMVRSASPSSRLAIEIQFSGPVNLGDVATGRLKNLIDCLYPVLGGRLGAPADDRIVELAASRDDRTVSGTAAIRVCEVGA